MTQEIRFALVGCGRVSSRHVDALVNHVPGARLVAVCDPVLERAQVYSKQLSIPAYSSTQEMYQAGGFDVVIIATPSGDHFERAMEAMRHQKHVVVEKPMALRLADAQVMSDEAKKRGVKLWVAFQNRYNPAVIKAKQTFDSGVLGKPVIGTARLRWCREQNYYDQDDWHGRWASDGGVNAQQAIHHIDALRWIFGEVESVEAIGATRLVKMECEDVSTATLRFKNGALGVIETMTAARPKDLEASLSLLGEGGTMVLGGIAMNRIDTWETVKPKALEDQDLSRFTQDVPSGYGFGHNVLFVRVAESVRNGLPEEISGPEGMKALEVLHAIYASMESGKRVYLKDQPRSKKLGVPKAAPVLRSGEGRFEEQGAKLCVNSFKPEELLKTWVAGIIGDRPSTFAKSPKLWNAAFGEIGTDAVFLPFDLDPDKLAPFVASLRKTSNFLGASVTMPYKISVMEHLDAIDPLAKRIGAINAIVRSPDGKLTGFNTDAEGARYALSKQGDMDFKPFESGLSGLTAVVLGTGGAGRTLASLLAGELGPKGTLYLCNRNAEKSASLARDLEGAGAKIEVIDYAGLKEIAPRLDLIANASTVGQAGLRALGGGKFTSLEGFSPLAEAKSATGETLREISLAQAQAVSQNQKESMEVLMRLKSTAKVYDAIYAPLETVLLKQARLLGLQTRNGKLMNIVQAADGMFHKVCRDLFTRQGIADEALFQRILKTMAEIW